MELSATLSANGRQRRAAAFAGKTALIAIIATALPTMAESGVQSAQPAANANQDCAVVRDYDDGSTMVLDANTQGRLFIGLTNPSFPSPAVATATVKVAVDDGLVYRVPAATIPYGFVVEMKNDELTRALLRNGRWIDFAAVEELRYSLEGSEEALAALFDCRPRIAAPNAAPPEAGQANARPPATETQATVGRYYAEMDTYARAADAREDWASLKKTFGATLSGREIVLAMRARQSDGRRFHVMTVPGFADKAAAEKFCRMFVERRRRCVVRLNGGD